MYGIQTSYLLAYFISPFFTVYPYVIAMPIISLKKYLNPSERIRNVCIVLSCCFLTNFILDMILILYIGISFRVIHEEIVIMLQVANSFIILFLSFLFGKAAFTATKFSDIWNLNVITSKPILPIPHIFLSMLLISTYFFLIMYILYMTLCFY